MTLEQGENAVLKLMDEYGDGSQPDGELVARMPELFDMAQKQLAQLQRIVRTAEIGAESREYPLPEDCAKVFRVWEGDETTRKWVQRGKTLLFSSPKARMLEYFATPETITEDTVETYEFEISEEAAACMPFFVAASLLSTDMVQPGGELMRLYNTMLAALDIGLPRNDRGGVKQSLWR